MLCLFLYKYTNNFQTLDNIIEFTKKMELIKATGDVNLEISNDPILVISTELGDYQLVLNLLDLGADINAFRKSRYAYGNTALIEAARYGYLDLVKLFIERGAHLDVTNFMGNTALMYAVINQQLEVAKLLLESGAEVDIPDKNNDTPLLIAAAKGYYNIVLLLLDHHANLNYIDFDNEDAFVLASKSDNYHIVELLKKYR